MGWLSLLEENGMLDGIYAHGSLVEASDRFVISADEERALVRILNEFGTITGLVFRACTSGLRSQELEYDEVRTTNSQMVVSSLTPVLSHGKDIVFVVELENTGDLPVYDYLLVNGVPEHCTFSRFLVNGGAGKVFINHYLSAQKLMVWKMYSPIYAGESLKFTSNGIIYYFVVIV